MVEFFNVYRVSKQFYLRPYNPFGFPFSCIISMTRTSSAALKRCCEGRHPCLVSDFQMKRLVFRHLKGCWLEVLHFLSDWEKSPFHWTECWHSSQFTCWNSSPRVMVFGAGGHWGVARSWPQSGQGWRASQVSFCCS